MVNRLVTFHKNKGVSNVQKVSGPINVTRNTDKSQIDIVKSRILASERVETDQEIESKLGKLESEYENRDYLWKKRNNMPYKNIIKNEDYSKKKFDKLEDFIVHRVTHKDKEGLDDELENFTKNIDQHNKELRSKFSVSKEAEYKKKFQYNNKEKFETYVASDTTHNKLKKNVSKFYEGEHKRLEEQKQKMDSIMDSLKTEGIL